MLKSLPKSEKEAIEAAFKTSKNVKEKERLLILKLLTQGYSHKETKRITGKCDDVIEKAVARYRQDGLTGLTPPPHPRNHSLLSLSQKDKIREILKKHPKPSLMGIKTTADNDFWNVGTLRLLTKKEFHVEYTCPESYQKLFKYCGYSYQKVEFADRRRNSEGREHFKERARIRLKKGVLSMSW